MLKQVGEELEWQAMSLYKVQVRQLAKGVFSLGVTGVSIGRLSLILRVTNFYTSKPACMCTTCCNIKKLCGLPHSVFVIHVILTLNTKYFPEHHKLIDLCNGNGPYFL